MKYGVDTQMNARVLILMHLEIRVSVARDSSRSVCYVSSDSVAWIQNPNLLTLSLVDHPMLVKKCSSTVVGKLF